MNPKSTDYRQGAMDAIRDLLIVIRSNNNQVTIQDVEQFQEGQLLAQKEITNNPHPIAVSKEEYIAKAQEVAAIQDGQDFGWLDEILAKVVFVQDATPDLVNHYTPTINAKATIQAHFTAQAKQHQADLLRARIDVLTKIKGYTDEMIDEPLIYYVRNQLEMLQAELDKLENK